MKGLKKRLLSLTVLLVTLVTVLGCSCEAMADIPASGGAKVYELEVNKTYKKYDLNEDGVADKIKIKADPNDENTVSWLKIYINDKKVYSKVYTTVENPIYRAYPTVAVIRLKSKKSLLYVNFMSYNGYFGGGWIYRYKSGKLKKRFDGTTLIKQFKEEFPGAVKCYEFLIKVKKNTLYFELSSSAIEDVVVKKLTYGSGAFTQS